MHRALVIGRYISNYGGAHKYLENLVRLLCQNNFEVAVGLEVDDGNSEFCAKIGSIGARIVNIPFDSQSRMKVIAIMDHIIQDFRPTIIDCEVAAKTVRNALISCKQFEKADCKKLFTMHLAIKSEDLPSTHLAMINPFGSWRRGLKERRKFLRMFDEGISVSEFHAKRISKLLGLKENFFTYVPNGVDVDTFSPTSRRENPVPVIGGCGGLVFQKRFDILLEAAKQLKERGCKFRVKIAGNGPELEGLQTFIAQHALADVAELVGYQEDVARFMSELDIFVMCSDNEGFPYAQLEAMASGLPSVVTEVGDFPSMVQNGIEGFMIARGDSLQLSEALFGLVNDKALRLKMGLKAREAVVQNYKVEDREQETLAKYIDLSQGRHSVAT